MQGFRLALVLAALPVIVAAAPGAAPNPGAFGVAVSGNHFVSTQNGAAVQLVGVNVSGLETGFASRIPPFRKAGKSFWAKLVNYKGYGVNTVRLPLNEASWLNYTCYDSGSGASKALYAAAAGGGYTPDPSGDYQATVKQAVADATAAGLYVILDLHWAAPNNAAGQPLCPIGQPGYADADHAVTFWTQIAATFKDNPAVIFELFNEPFGDNTYAKWVSQNRDAYSAGPQARLLSAGGSFAPFDSQNNLNGNAMFTDGITWNVAGMLTLLHTVRAQGASNVVLAAPIGWAGEIETWLDTYATAGNPDPLKQFGVAWHIYGYAKGTAPPLAILAAGYPIIVTETHGFDSGIDGKQNVDGYTWAAAHGVGYLCWAPVHDWSGGGLGLNGTPPWAGCVPPSR